MRFQAVAPLFLLMVLAHGKLPIMEGGNEVFCKEGDCFLSPLTTLALEVRVEYDVPSFNVTTYVPISLDSESLSRRAPQSPISFEDITPRSITMIVTDHFFEYDGTPVANNDRRVLNVLERHGASPDENLGSFMQQAMYCVLDTTDTLEGRKSGIERRTEFGEPMCQPNFRGAPLVLNPKDTSLDGIVCQIIVGGGCVDGFPVELKE